MISLPHTTNVPELTYEQKVANSMAALDALWPKWVDKIDLDTLSMSDSRRCILGQIAGDYVPAVYMEHDVLDGKSLNDDLFLFWGGTNEWKDAIIERRRTAPLAADIPTAEDRLREAVRELRAAGWDVTVTATRQESINV